MVRHIRGEQEGICADRRERCVRGLNYGCEIAVAATRALVCRWLVAVAIVLARLSGERSFEVF